MTTAALERRLRRSRAWAAPGAGWGAFIGLLLQEQRRPGIELPAGHEQHH